MCVNIKVSANEPYDVYNYDRWGDAVPSQAGYIADKAVTGEDLGAGHFSSPSDIFRDSNDKFYIADSGNNRIVIVNPDFQTVADIMEEFDYNGETLTLDNPTGIYVSPEDNQIYIADNGNGRVIRCNSDGKVNLVAEKPASEVYPQQLTFLPQKVLADKAGNIYVVVSNITSGAVMFDKDGGFVGYYGANRVQQTTKVLSDYFWNTFATEEQRANRQRTVPTGFTNFDIDNEGFIFTCTENKSGGNDVVKKLNPAGYNIFDNGNTYTFGDYEAMVSSPEKVQESEITDIDINNDGTINCLDLSSGRIFQYDEECNLLFIIGTTAEQTGGFRQVVALESMDDKLYVLDTLKQSVTIFKQTVFGQVVHEATDLYNQGYYEEALEPWYEVLRRDGNYRRANIGIASALINKGEYREAMKYAKNAGSSEIYDKAFEGYRSEFLKKHFSDCVAGLAVIIIALKIKAKKQNRWW